LGWEIGRSILGESGRRLQVATGERLSHRRQNNFERRNARGRDLRDNLLGTPHLRAYLAPRARSPAVILIHLIKIKQSNRVPLP
jgi:hypothetical protein